MNQEIRLVGLSVLVIGMGLVGCGDIGDGVGEGGGRVKVVATTMMIGDMVEEVGGDRVEVTVLMGPGVDPHLYKARPSDRVAISAADLVFYNGFRLEGQLGEIFRDGRVAAVAVAESLSREELIVVEGGEVDPHVWGDPRLWAECLSVVVDALSRIDPEGAAEFVGRGREYARRLMDLHEWAEESVGKISEGQRLLVTSHDAFGYFGRAFGLEVDALQGLSTAAGVGLADQTRLVATLRERGVKAVFAESSVSPRLIESVKRDAGVELGGELFSDSTGARGDMIEIEGVEYDLGTYEGMVRYNVWTIVEALR